MKRKSGFMRKVKYDDDVCKYYGPEFHAKGCSPKHIQAALLSMCGVDAGIIRLVLFGVF